MILTSNLSPKQNIDALQCDCELAYLQQSDHSHILETTFLRIRSQQMGEQDWM